MPSLTLDDFTPIPVSQEPDNAIWLLWHPDTGAYTLDTTQKNRKKGRMVTLSSNGKPPVWSALVGTPVTFGAKPKRHLSASLPKDAPAGGEALFKIAIECLRHGYEATALQLRPGRNFSDFKKAVCALALLAQRNQSRILFSHVHCDSDHRKTIREERLANEALVDFRWGEDVLVSIDLNAWFGPYSRQGSEGAFQREQGGKASPATLQFDDPTKTPSGHEITESAATIREFYERAAADLGLSPEQIARRLATLGIEAP